MEAAMQKEARGKPLEYPVLRARRIELVDENGKIRITLDGMAAGPCLRLWDAEGQMKCSLGLLTTGQPTLMFFTGYMPRVNLRLDKQGDPAFSLIDTATLEVAEVMIEAWKKEARKKAQPATPPKAQTAKKEGE
jgi:hypothetical protein